MARKHFEQFGSFFVVVVIYCLYKTYANTYLSKNIYVFQRPKKKVHNPKMLNKVLVHVLVTDLYHCFGIELNF